MKLRFSIRDLLWLTALVAVLVGWWLDHRHLMVGQGRYSFYKTRKGDLILDNTTDQAWVRIDDAWVDAGW
jgi:hypothetical protein